MWEKPVTRHQAKCQRSGLQANHDSDQSGCEHILHRPGRSKQDKGKLDARALPVEYASYSNAVSS